MPVVLGALLFAAFLAKGPWDSDYYWHVADRPSSSPRASSRGPIPFSFTWGGMPWTLHEWLGELLLFRLVDGLGYMGAVYVYALIPGITIGDPGASRCTGYGLRTAGRRRSRRRCAALLVIPYATIRPQAVSWIMFALLIAGLDPPPTRPGSVDARAGAAVRRCGRTSTGLWVVGLVGSWPSTPS